MMTVYNLLMAVVVVLALPVAAVVTLFSEKRRKTLLHRMGLLPMPGPKPAAGSRPVWVHALSVGEVRSAFPLVQALRRDHPRQEMVFSASTHTGFKTACGLMQALAVRVVYFPYDLPGSVRRAAARIDPALVIIVETDIWPNFLHVMAQRQVPVVLANGRLSDRSFAGYRRLAGWSRALFAGFRAVCVQTEADARRFQRLGLAPERIHVTGNLKFDQPVLPPGAAQVRTLGRSLGLCPDCPVLVAGSTHKGEEAILARALARIQADLPQMVLIVAPRDPGRAGEICRTFSGAGFSAVRLSQRGKKTDDPEPDVLVVDTMGTLGRLYALADVAFVGGSLVSCGGHNPLEPAALAKPVLFGPDMSDFKAIARLLTETGGGRRVKDMAELTEAARSLLARPETAKQMGDRARFAFEAHQGATARTLAVVSRIMTPARVAGGNPGWGGCP
ncbi:MAG: 3-deoxy-D-manno-octulosonic acid transferase [Desulfobacterales bacterium]|nr:3-deoxy-D-manno-octulosonic acid transferase [Desulfobacterales bacterium]